MGVEERGRWMEWIYEEWQIRGEGRGGNIEEWREEVWPVRSRVVERERV
jgi:hypothetical protein